jgi:hypothetical protein
VGLTAGVCGRTGRSQDGAGPGRVAGAHCWVGQGRWPACVVGRGAAEVGGVIPGDQHVLLGWVRWGQLVWLDGAGPAAGARCEAGRGGWHAAKARRGQVRVGRGMAGRTWSGRSSGGRRVGSGESGWPMHGEQAAGHKRAGRVGKNEKIDGIHKLGA